MPVKLIHEVVDKLKVLYSNSNEDRPDSVLSAYPNTKKVVQGLQYLLDAVFPGRNPNHDLDQSGLDNYLLESLQNGWTLLLPEIEKAIPLRWNGQANLRNPSKEEQESIKFLAAKVASDLFNQLPKIRSLVIKDIMAAYDGDPAAHSYAEVKMAFPGVLAIASHRIAHELYLLNVPSVPRIMSEWIHSKTGCDIHPGAKIGEAFFVDHPTGVVIGETAVIGNNVKLYQGVTLGAKSFPLDENGKPIKHIRRHPTVEDNVVIYSNATILGGETVIGKGSTVGGNVFLLESVPPDSFVSSSSGSPKIKAKS